MSDASATQEKTRTAPARVPDGYWKEHPRYRRYVLFAATGVPLWFAALAVLGVLRATGVGFSEWEAYMGTMASPLWLVVNAIALAMVCWFSIRWLIVGIKIPGVRLGPIPAPPDAAVAVAQFAGLGALTAIIVIVLCGVVI